MVARPRAVFKSTVVVEAVYNQNLDVLGEATLVIIPALKANKFRLAMNALLRRVRGASKIRRAFRRHRVKRRLQIANMVELWEAKEGDIKNLTMAKTHVPGDFIPIWQAIGRQTFKVTKIKFCNELYVIHQSRFRRAWRDWQCQRQAIAPDGEAGEAPPLVTPLYSRRRQGSQSLSSSTTLDPEPVFHVDAERVLMVDFASRAEWKRITWEDCGIASGKRVKNPMSQPTKVAEVVVQKKKLQQYVMAAQAHLNRKSSFNPKGNRGSKLDKLEGQFSARRQPLGTLGESVLGTSRRLSGPQVLTQGVTDTKPSGLEDSFTLSTAPAPRRMSVPQPLTKSSFELDTGLLPDTPFVPAPPSTNDRRVTVPELLARVDLDTNILSTSLDLTPLENGISPFRRKSAPSRPSVSPKAPVRPPSFRKPNPLLGTAPRGQSISEKKTSPRRNSGAENALPDPRRRRSIEHAVVHFQFGRQYPAQP